MPKKFKGENSKAVEARERRDSKKQAEVHRKQREEEDAYWRDDDKRVHRKEQRKVSSLCHIRGCTIVLYVYCRIIFVAVRERE